MGMVCPERGQLRFLTGSDEDILFIGPFLVISVLSQGTAGSR